MSGTRSAAGAADLEELENEKIRITLLLAKEYLNHEPSLEVPTDPIAVPSSTRRSGLSAIINHLLNRKLPQEEDTAQNDDVEDEEEKLPSLPFDFLVNQKLLRTSIEVAARREGLGLEQAIEIQYFPALPPPLQQETSIQQEPDWI
jgi:ribosome biogenesis protein YTM1